MIAVEARHVAIARSRRPVIFDTSLSVERATVTGVVGPSGSGKTTLLRAIAGVQRVARGSLTVLGVPAGSPALRRRIGYMPQEPSLYEDLTVLENLRYFADVAERPDRVGAVARLVALESRLGSVVRETSGGERSRTSLAIALLTDPELLVLDEPTVGLDPLLRRALWSTFRAAAADGATVLVSTHVMDEAERCDRLLLLRDGRPLASASPVELRRETGASSLEDAFVALAGAR